jgi:hypothetical protein
MSAKRVLLTAVLCLGLIFGIFQGASAKATPGPCRISVLRDQLSFSNHDCSSYYISPGWFALTPALVNVFIQASSSTASLTGDNNVNLALTTQQAANLWEPIQTLEDNIFGLNCPTGLVYLSDVKWDLGKLDLGTYTLKFFQTLSHPLIDGIGSCTVDQTGQGLSNIIYAGTQLDTETTVTITP